MSAEAQLEAFLDIISSSARRAIAEYKKAGNSIPTINSTEFHPLDSAIDTVELKKAIRLLEGTCQQLCASLAPPQHTIVNLAKCFDWACLGIAHRKRIADVLDKHLKGLHVNKLSQVVGLDDDQLARVLRFLGSKGCFSEVDKDVFANNRLSLVTKNTNNTGCLIYRITVSPAGPESTYHTCASEAQGDGRKLLRFIDISPCLYLISQVPSQFFKSEQEQIFHKAMIGVGEVTGSLSIIYQYPWNGVSTVCDIGCSIGTFGIPLAKAHRHLKITNQDLENVIIEAREAMRLQAWGNEAQDVLQEQRVDFVALNFLEEALVSGKDVYYLRFILHDWPDTEVLIILRNLRKAMGPHSRLLIHEHVLIDTYHSDPTEDVGIDVPPEPMLPNFGAGSANLYSTDLGMLVLNNGKELSTLAATAGLRFERAYDFGCTVVLEFSLA
ncbi:S-adenosyl-L-methionine-dependent methyltransferase [Scleroderma citrinum]